MHARRDRRRAGAVGALTAAALLALALAAPAAPARAGTPPVLGWHGCSGQPGFQCAALTVPLDYDSPGGQQIQVAVIRHRATDSAHRVGSLFWNPGGPGGGGTTSLASFYSSFPVAVRERFDVVSFDPRGIGASTPLKCFQTPEQEAAVLGELPPGFPVGPAEERRQRQVFSRFDQACASHGGPIQNHMSTANVARDMDRLRAATGDRRLNFYGTSYGTYLAATYINLFPSRTGRVVLDGNVSPVDWTDARDGAVDNTFVRLESPLATETGLREMLAACGLAGRARCSFSAGTPAATLDKYRSLLGRVSAAPVTVSGQRFTYALVVSSVAAGLVAQNDNPVTHTGWADLADLLQALWDQPNDGGDVRLPERARALVDAAARGPLAGLASDSAEPLTEGLLGVLCSESPNPSAAGSYGDQARRANAAQSPDGFAYAWSWLAQPCADWRAKDADRYTGPWNTSTGPLLVIGTLSDSNTAYVGSQRMAVQLANTRLLTETGGGHTALINRSDCVDQYTSAYLLRGTLPAPGAVCAQNRQPF